MTPYDVANAIEALSEGLALFDAEERLVFCNRRFRDAHSPLGELLQPGLLWPIFVAEAHRRGIGWGLEQIDMQVTSGADETMAIEAERPGERWVRLGFRPIAEGGFLLTHGDITEMRAAEEMRVDADEALHEVLNACAPQIVMCQIGTGEIIYRTPAWTANFGMIDSVQKVYVRPELRADFLADLMSQGVVDGFETDLRRADGVIMPVRISSRIMDYHGEKVVVSFVQDMTQLHAQRDEIVRTNQRLFDAIEALDQGFALFDADDRLVLANRRWMGVNAAISDIAFPGASNTEIVQAAQARGAAPALAGRLPDAPTRSHMREEVTLGDGRCFAISRRPTSDGGFVLAWRDVTERRAAEEELRRQREATHQNEKLTALGELLASVAHELNNPLSVVVGHSLMLREETADPTLLRRIEKISVAAERCARIVKTFLAMARERPTERAPASVRTILDTALEMTAHSIQTMGVELEVDPVRDLPPVLADADQMAQLFVNLIVNAGQAVAARGRDGRIQIAARHDTDRRAVIITIADNGPGVPDDLRARIFEPFFTTKEIGDGTGVGLALCHRIASAHGARIEVSESPLGGALFSVLIPETQASPSSEVTDDGGQSARGIKALIVEDEGDVAEVVTDILSGIGVETALAVSAEDALRLIEGGDSFDLIFSDLKMPGMGGRGLLGQIERNWPNLRDRMVFITGDAMSPEAAEIRDAATLPLLEKPIAPSDLRAVVASIAVSR
ncbi:MAG: PAS-domain containing protein [Pseudomonadota bacterium]